MIEVAYRHRFITPGHQSKFRSLERPIPIAEKNIKPVIAKKNCQRVLLTVGIEIRCPNGAGGEISERRVGDEIAVTGS